MKKFKYIRYPGSNCIVLFFVRHSVCTKFKQTLTTHTLNIVLTITCKPKFNGNGTFLQIPESMIPGWRQLQVTSIGKKIGLVQHFIFLRENVITCDTYHRT